MAKLTKRQKELLNIASDHLNDTEFFDFYDWDGLFVEEIITEKELAWLDDHFTATVIFTPKDTNV